MLKIALPSHRAKGLSRAAVLLVLKMCHEVAIKFRGPPFPLLQGGDSHECDPFPEANPLSTNIR